MNTDNIFFIVNNSKKVFTDTPETKSPNAANTFYDIIGKAMNKQSSSSVPSGMKLMSSRHNVQPAAPLSTPEVSPNRSTATNPVTSDEEINKGVPVHNPDNEKGRDQEPADHAPIAASETSVLPAQAALIEVNGSAKPSQQFSELSQEMGAKNDGKKTIAQLSDSAKTAVEVNLKEASKGVSKDITSPSDIVPTATNDGTASKNRSVFSQVFDNSNNSTSTPANQTSVSVLHAAAQKQSTDKVDALLNKLQSMESKLDSSSSPSSAITPEAVDSISGKSLGKGGLLTKGGFYMAAVPSLLATSQNSGSQKTGAPASAVSTINSASAASTAETLSSRPNPHLPVAENQTAKSAKKLDKASQQHFNKNLTALKGGITNSLKLGKDKLEISLTPEHLGKVTVKLNVVEGSRISVSMHVENGMARAMITEQIPMIRSQIESMNYVIDNFNVSVPDGALAFGDNASGQSGSQQNNGNSFSSGGHATSSVRPTSTPSDSDLVDGSLVSVRA